MNRFWNAIIKPVFEDKSVKNIVEIGTQSGKNTVKILNYCKENEGHLVCIDPLTPKNIDEWKLEYEGYLSFYSGLSLSVLPLIKEYDAVLIDGDHNWYTVFNELKIIEDNIKNRNSSPIVFLHDIGWPYGRRDLYYNPDNIPIAYRQAYKKSGVLPYDLNLSDEGFNSHLFNSIYENNPKNGILTAIEDFISETDLVVNFYKIPVFHGLGILTFGTSETLPLFQNENWVYELLEAAEKSRIEQLMDVENKRKMIDGLNYSIKDIQDLNRKLQILNENLEREIEEQKYKLNLEQYNLERSQLQESQRNLENELKQTNKIVEKLQLDIVRLNEKNSNLLSSLKRAENTAAIHLNSIRYRLGDIIVSGLKPSKNTFLMPVRIAKLLLHGFRKRKMRIDKNRSVDLKKKLDREIVSTPAKNADPRRLYQEIIDKQENIDWLLPGTPPLVSIIVINRNGQKHLARLLSSILKYNEYKNIEFIVVDNNSTDKSVEVINGYSNHFNIKIIKNEYNASFSEANNQAAKAANGEYLLLMNNDVEPTKGWLSELVRCMQQNPLVGTCGSRLIYSIQPEGSMNKPFELTIQHTGIAFQRKDGLLQPYNLNKGVAYDSTEVMEQQECAAVTAACLLVRKNLYMDLQGLDEGYVYGYEDVDFGLKVLSAGFKNIYCPTSVLFHYEFGTQKENSRHELRDRRIANRNLLYKKWNKWINRELFLDKLNHNFIISKESLKVAMIVTECGDNVTAGDYFTALELGQSLNKIGWEVEYIPRKGNGNWYVISEDVDVLVSLLDAYDPAKVRSGNPNLIKIAWMRNWFERWAEKPNFNEYDILLASSKIACDLVQEKTGRKVELLRIATNADRFLQGTREQEMLCDYCFTGSYWNDAREIMDLLKPQNINYKLHIYGKNWDSISEFKPYHYGFVPYDKMPNIYKSTKIVIDDANRVTKPYGAVNSRVFDAIAAGALVITNGGLGSQDAFDGELPVFTSSDELESIVNYYLSNEEARQEKVQSLQNIVLNNHTYQHRAIELKGILSSFVANHRIAIKIAAPKWETVHEWGDYHMALGLKRQFEALGHRVIIQLLYEWDNGEDENCNIVIVLRGLNAYKPKKHHFNIMWNISHPDKITTDEMNAYDYVFISSEYWAEQMKSMLNVPVEAMLQCTDPEIFRIPENQHVEQYKKEVLFVGNSRKIFRKIIKDLLPTDRDLSIYGTNWEAFVDSKYIKGKHISNTELYNYYGSSDILLNDHWDEMRDKGFISNRIFDALATEAFIISDKVRGLEKEFGDSIVTYNTPEELKELVEYYLSHPEHRKDKAKKGAQIVLEKHTYKQRVARFLEIINARL
ncbi:glycosyltransferase family protein [Paenibacillus antibioticophila]|uniref:glycosyltransferase family protein n=1 Tax=Paenibacillus antibioticophila TaxID=1274374 RepID=UPI0006782824|nr:glycosyltransferase [Paenibacillus antibioticophila]